MPNAIRRRRLGGSPYPMRAAQFTGSSSQFLSIADNAALSMGTGVLLTIAGWVYPQSSGVVQDYIAKGAAAGSREYLVRQDATDKLQWLVQSGGGTQALIQSLNAFNLNAWNFFVCQYDGVNIANSTDNGTVQSTAFALDIADAANTFRLGSRSDGAEFLTGRLDSVGIWKRVLTAGEISQVFRGGTGLAYRDLSGALLTSLVAWWDLDDSGGSSAVWIDKVGTNHLTAGAGAAAPTSAAGKR